MIPERLLTRSAPSREQLVNRCARPGKIENGGRKHVWDYSKFQIWAEKMSQNHVNGLFVTFPRSLGRYISIKDFHWLARIYRFIDTPEPQPNFNS